VEYEEAEGGTGIGISMGMSCQFEPFINAHLSCPSIIKHLVRVGGDFLERREGTDARLVVSEDRAPPAESTLVQM
jgi:hypothetical protein